MKNARLALNRWTMGQVLMPVHFFALQDTLLEHMSLRARLPGLPAYGVAQLEWNDESLAKGAINVSALTVVFPSGKLIDVPGNASGSNLNLGNEDGNRASVFLHLLDTAEDLTEADVGHDLGQVPRSLYRVALSTRAYQEDGTESMKLAELERTLGSDWQLSSYVPPLLQVGTSPFLRSLIAEIERLIAHLQLELTAQLDDVFLGQEHVVRLRRGQAAAYRMQAFLTDCQRQIHLHPYFLFSALRDFYAEVCFLNNAEPDVPPPAYDHDDLGSCFGQLETKLRDRLDIAPLTSVRLPFVRDDYYFIAQPFPSELARANKVYLVVQHPRGENIAFEEVKLAGPSRLEPVHTLSLPGVPLEPILSPSFYHTFGGRARLYLMDHRTDEFAHAMRERALCFYASEDLLDLEVALSWQL